MSMLFVVIVCLATVVVGGVYSLITIPFSLVFWALGAWWPNIGWKLLFYLGLAVIGISAVYDLTQSIIWSIVAGVVWLVTFYFVLLNAVE